MSGHPKVAIISSSQLGKFGRMDAQFHIAVQQVGDRVQELEQTMTREEVIMRLDGLMLADLKPITPLLRSAKTFNAQSATAAIQEYPFIAYALIERDIDKAIERGRVEVAHAEANIDRLQTIANRRPTS